MVCTLVRDELYVKVQVKGAFGGHLLRRSALSASCYVVLLSSRVSSWSCARILTYRMDPCSRVRAPADDQEERAAGKNRECSLRETEHETRALAVRVASSLTMDQLKMESQRVVHREAGHHLR